jgi:predicted anti-sigma-YlaC factor YlaD
MHCEEVQNELARESITTALVGEVQSHLQECATCRRVQLLYSRMDDALKRNFVWHPPEGFVESVVARATPVLQSVPEPPRILAWDIFRRSVLSLLLIAIMYFGVRLVLETSVRLAAAMAANTLLVSWTCVALSLGVSFWFTRRALR